MSVYICAQLNDALTSIKSSYAYTQMEEPLAQGTTAQHSVRPKPLYWLGPNTETKTQTQQNKQRHVSELCTSMTVFQNINIIKVFLEKNNQKNEKIEGGKFRFMAPKPILKLDLGLCCRY